MIGLEINGYKIQKIIGSGGMADVYLGVNTLGQKAAIKVLKKQFNENENIKTRFFNEAKTIVSLHNENIVKVFDFKELGDYSCIIMEFLDGKNLRDYMDSKQALHDEKITQIFKGCLNALAYTHSKGVVHRDIKPSNIFFTNNGQVKVVDFGIAKTKEAAGTITNQTLGTVLFMSPEQVVDPKRVDTKTDIYSLGVTLYSILTGKFPYDAKTDSDYIIQNKIVTEELDLSFVPQKWKPILNSLLNKRPENRPSAKDLLNNIDISSATSFENNITNNGNNTVQIPEIKKNNYLLYLGIFIVVSVLSILSFKLLFNSEDSIPKDVQVSSKVKLYDKVINEGTITVGVEPNGPPLNYLEGNDRKGFDFDFFKEVAKEMGIKEIIFNEDFYYDDLPDQAKLGTFDIFMGGYIPDPEIKDVIWSNSYLDFGLCLIVLEGSAIRSVKDLTNKRVGLYEGDNTAKNWIQENIPTIETLKTYTDDGEVNWMNCILKDEVDAIIYDYPFAVEEIKNFNNLRIAQVNLNESYYSVGIPGRHNHKFLANLNIAIKKVMNKPIYGDLVRKYLKSDGLSGGDIKETSEHKVYLIKKGDSLGSIAERHLGSSSKWYELFEINKSTLPNPHLIFENTQILIPKL